MVVFDSPTDFYLSRSNEADILALSGNPDVADQISILIGELSPFHENHDVYAEGCTFETPVFAPNGWRDRSIPVTYDDIGVTAHFMELHDLVLSKIGAGRPKDIEFCSALFKTQYLNRDILIERLPLIACSSDQKQVIENRIKRYFH
jgi:Nucleotidyltransferase of unknown function (DUF6036)